MAAKRDSSRTSADKGARIDATLSAEDLAKLDALFVQAEALMPFLIALASSERAELLRAGDKLIEGSVEIIALVREYGDYFPKAVADPDEMARDAALDVALAHVEARLARLLQLVQDARLLARSDLARKALAAYALTRFIPDHIGVNARIEKLKDAFTPRARR